MKLSDGSPLPVPALTAGLVVIGCLAVCAAPAKALTITSVSQSGTQIGLYQPLTVRFGLSRSYTNPYDPAAVDAKFEFTGPSGIVRFIPAFWVADTPGWMARIVPLELGAHTCRIVATDSTGESANWSLSFTAVASGARGFVRVDPRNPRYLRFDNGDPYRPVGQNLAWGLADSIFTTWLNDMAAARENWTRYWMAPHAGQGLEWGPRVTSPTLGKYSQSQAQTFDTQLVAARDRGIEVQLCLDSFNGWNYNFYSDWASNIYNTANGGMCARPLDYFTNADAKRYARQLLRYIVARWAYNTGILCWEFFNEIDALGSGGNGTFWGNEQTVADWHQEMAQYVRSIDPFGHLRTTSFAYGGPESSYALFWQLPEMEIVQLHRYSIIVPQEHINLIRSVASYGKPVIMGEGNEAGDPSQLETDGSSILTLSWASAVEQSGIMSWWWDNWIDPHNLYGRFTPVAAYLAGEDWAPHGLGPLSATKVAGPSDLQLYGASGTRYAYVFVNCSTSGTSGVRVRLGSLLAGTYTIEYWDTSAGTIISTTTVSTGAAPTLNLPTFDWSIGIKVKTTGPVLIVTPTSLTAALVCGTNAPNASFTVKNDGASTLSYTISDNVNWLTVSPTSGSSTTETDTITVQYNTASLAPAVYPAAITVTDSSGINPPQTVSVELTVTSRAGDMDGDNDVDQADFGRFQACLLGTTFRQTDPGCAAADLDGDGFVAGSDVVLFMQCLSGPNALSNPNCAN